MYRHTTESAASTIIPPFSLCPKLLLASSQPKEFKMFTTICLESAEQTIKLAKRIKKLHTYLYICAYSASAALTHIRYVSDYVPQNPAYTLLIYMFTCA